MRGFNRSELVKAVGGPLDSFILTITLGTRRTIKLFAKSIHADNE